MSFEFLRRKNEKVALVEGEDVAFRELRQEQINNMIQDAAILAGREEFLGQARKMSHIPPKDSYKYLLELRNETARDQKEAEMAKKIKDSTEKMMEILKFFFGGLDKEVVARVFFSREMTRDDRAELFWEYYNKNKEGEKKEISLTDQAMHVAALLLVEARSGGSMKEAEKDIKTMVASESGIFEKIKIGLSIEESESPKKLGEALLQYFREKKRREISEAK